MTDPHPPGSDRADLADRADLEVLLRSFYGRVLTDDVLGEPFTKVRESTGLDAHIPLMADFWETVLFRAGRYPGSPLPAHQLVHQLTPLSSRHFIRWLMMWQDAVDALYSGPVADDAKIQASRIAWSMHRRLTGGNSADLDAVVDAVAAC